MADDSSTNQFHGLDHKTLKELMDSWCDAAVEAGLMRDDQRPDMPALTLMLQQDSDGNVQVTAMAFKDVLGAALPDHGPPNQASPGLPIASITFVRDQAQSGS